MFFRWSKDRGGDEVFLTDGRWMTRGVGLCEG
jgi:hypothetical protein